MMLGYPMEVEPKRCVLLASFPGFTRALVLRPIRNAFLISLSTSTRVKSGNEAGVLLYLHVQ